MQPSVSVSIVQFSRIKQVHFSAFKFNSQIVFSVKETGKKIFIFIFSSLSIGILLYCFSISPGFPPHLIKTIRVEKNAAISKIRKREVA